MIAIPKHWYAWQLVYRHDVIETNDNFDFLGIGDKLPPVFFANRGCFVEQESQSKHQY